MTHVLFHRSPVRHLIPCLAVVTGLLVASCGSHQEAKLPTSPTKPALAQKAKLPQTAAEKFSFTKPIHVKGIYITAWIAGSTNRMGELLNMIDNTELNCMVIDVRDSGMMYFKTGIPLAAECKATSVGVPKPDKLMEKLVAHHVWPVARIACFRDNYVPLKHPERAVLLPTGQPWKDRSKHTWLDPYDKRNWEYLAQTVEFAMDAGFPEIQLDYVRFPSEGKSSTQVFPNKKNYPDPKAAPEDVVQAFAQYIADKVHAKGKLLSADIFGIISSSKSDQGIGQELEKVAKPFDIVSPMCYPSHYHKGEYGIKDPNQAPYEIIRKSLTDYRKRIPGKTLRPWLQDFSMGVHYDASKVRAQIKAAEELGYTDWLLWNAGNHYTREALRPKSTK